ncbi:hypothetical protein M3926_000635 [Vibrio metschnikovii]|nr:hypothetical protein [Vibrio metschnikovii]
MTIKIIASSLSSRCIIELYPQVYLKDIVSLKTLFIVPTSILSEAKHFSLFSASKILPYLERRYSTCSLSFLIEEC